MSDAHAFSLTSEPSAVKPRADYWWACTCGEEGGPCPLYEHAWDAWVAHTVSERDLQDVVRRLGRVVRTLPPRYRVFALIEVTTALLREYSV